MSKFFDKLKSFLFEEEEEDDEVEQKPAVPSKPAVQPVTQPVKKQPRVISLEPTDVKPAPVKPSEPEQPKGNRSEYITIPTKKDKEPLRKDTVLSERPQRDKSATDNYNFSEIISPIYGVREAKDEDGKPVAKPITLKNPSKAPEKSPLGTVLSPMYGPVEDKKEPVPSRIASLTVDDLVTGEIHVDQKKEASQPAKKKAKAAKETVSLFDDEEQ